MKDDCGLTSVIGRRCWVLSFLVSICMLLVSCGGGGSDSGEETPTILPPSVNVTGGWEMSINRNTFKFNIVQSESKISGTYYSSPRGVSGTINGTVSDNILDFKMIDKYRDDYGATILAVVDKATGRELIYTANTFGNYIGGGSYKETGTKYTDITWRIEILNDPGSAYNDKTLSIHIANGAPSDKFALYQLYPMYNNLGLIVSDIVDGSIVTGEQPQIGPYTLTVNPNTSQSYDLPIQYAVPR